jgi:hypothetical protein
MRLKLDQTTWTPGGVQDVDLQRITLEGDLYILKFSELRLLYRINQEEPQKDNNEAWAWPRIVF